MLRRSFLGLTLFLVLALAAGLHSSASPVPPPGLLADIRWDDDDDPLFGGISALALDATGMQFTAVSDHGAWLRGRLQRNSQGHLLAVTQGPVTRLQRPDGTPLRHGQTDSEGLALAPDGSAFVSFEGGARVRHYPSLSGPAESLDSPPEFAQMDENASLESLCMGPDGSLYTLPEGPRGRLVDFPVFRYLNGAWGHFGVISRKDEFRAVDCSIGPDGRFYLLERAFYGLGGFASRLMRFDIGTAGLTGAQTLFQTENGTFDDLEGLAVWRDATGHLRATMVSDDNFSVFFVTELVEYALPD